MRRGIIRRLEPYLGSMMAVADVLIVGLTAITCYWLFFGFGVRPVPIHYKVVLSSWPLLVPMWFSHFNLYELHRGESLFIETKRLLIAWILLFACFAVLMLITKSGALYSRLWLGTLFISGAGSLVLFRISLRAMLALLRSKGFNIRYIFIVGECESLQAVTDKLSTENAAGLSVVQTFPVYERGEKILGLEGLSDGLKVHDVDQVWIASGAQSKKLLKQALEICSTYSVSVIWVPDLFNTMILQRPLTQIVGLPTVQLQNEPLSNSSLLYKSLMDRSLALLIFMFLSPLFAFIAVLIKLDSSGPILYRQLRHGWNGREIEIYKFRTMVMHMDEKGPIKLASKNDFRVTKVGRFLRRSSLDELPQFINVLQGRMSIVGPRPHPVSLENLYHSYTPVYALRYKVKPGITGWAQVNGLRGNTDTPDKLKFRVEYDLYYIKHWSIWFDVKIIALTILRGFNHPNAY